VPAIVDQYSRPVALSQMPRRKLTRPVSARYDAAQTNADNRNHWGAADALSADAAASSSIRAILRKRSRYETENNCYARGIVNTLANDTIGTGPRLQMLTDSATVNRDVERDFASWCLAVSLPAKLRTMRRARATDGEAFAIMASNPNLKHDVKLDLRLAEAERVTSGYLSQAESNDHDGILTDAYGNPVSYRVLRHHPGGAYGMTFSEDADNVAAEFVLHWLNHGRPEQHRGIPELTPALPLFAQLRRYTRAVLGAAESAADFAAVMYAENPAEDDDVPLPAALDEVELTRNMMLTLPAGWKLGQMDPKQPSATYAEFKHELVNEIARCFNMPFNIASGNSAGYNYASGRLDHQTYFRAIRVDQDEAESVVLDRILVAWLREYWLVKNLFVAPGHAWFWAGHEHVDPAKEATAQAKRLASRTTTLYAEYATAGKDWEKETDQWEREQIRIAQGMKRISEAGPQQEADNG